MPKFQGCKWNGHKYTLQINSPPVSLTAFKHRLTFYSHSLPHPTPICPPPSVQPEQLFMPLRSIKDFTQGQHNEKVKESSERNKRYMLVMGSLNPVIYYIKELILNREVIRFTLGHSSAR